MIKIGEGFCLKDFDLEILRNLPVDSRKSPDINYLRKDSDFKWIEYTKYTNGSLQLTINASKHATSHVQQVKEYLKDVIDIEVPATSIQFCRTIGTVDPHIDKVRQTSINIGLHNSHLGITKMGRNRNYLSFLDHHEDFVVREGCSYLVDVSNVHSVVTNSGAVERYLIAASFSIPFAGLKQKLKNIL